MTGPIPNNQDVPLDPESCKHHMQLVKSAHCCRPVIYLGLKQYINGLSIYHDGGRVAMTVYLGGKKDGIDSREIQIMPS